MAHRIGTNPGILSGSEVLRKVFWGCCVVRLLSFHPSFQLPRNRKQEMASCLCFVPLRFIHRFRDVFQFEPVAFGLHAFPFFCCEIGTSPHPQSCVPLANKAGACSGWGQGGGVGPGEGLGGGGLSWHSMFVFALRLLKETLGADCKQSLFWFFLRYLHQAAVTHDGQAGLHQTKRLSVLLPTGDLQKSLSFFFFLTSLAFF